MDNMDKEHACTVGWELLLAHSHSPTPLVSVPWLGLGGAAPQECEARAKPGECFPHYILSVSGNLLLRDFLSQRLYPYLSALCHLMGLWRGGDHTCGVSLGEKSLKGRAGMGIGTFGAAVVHPRVDLCFKHNK